jgi:hypothetical protein
MMYLMEVGFGIANNICYTIVRSSILQRRHQKVTGMSKWVFVMDQAEFCQDETQIVFKLDTM